MRDGAGSCTSWLPWLGPLLLRDWDLLLRPGCSSSAAPGTCSWGCAAGGPSTEPPVLGAGVLLSRWLAAGLLSWELQLALKECTCQGLTWRPDCQPHLLARAPVRPCSTRFRPAAPFAFASCVLLLLLKLNVLQLVPWVVQGVHPSCTVPYYMPRRAPRRRELTGSSGPLCRPPLWPLSRGQRDRLAACRCGRGGHSSSPP